MIKPTVFCDVCGKPKGDVNHWWIYREHDSHGRQFALADWDNVSAKQQGVLHLCGAECVQKKVNEFLGSKV